MTRPQIIRADTIDLQDPQAPSAQDHTRPPHRPNPLGHGPSPHQADALRHAGKEAASEQQRSPRVSWIEGEGLTTSEGQASQGGAARAAHEHLHDGFVHADDATIVPDAARSESPSDDMTLVDNDDDELDDDLLQNMSSSPSIDDGGCYHSSLLLPASTPRHTRLRHPSPSLPDNPSSSPYLFTPRHLPLAVPPRQDGVVAHGHRHRHHCHRRSEYRQGVEEDDGLGNTSRSADTGPANAFRSPGYSWNNSPDARSGFHGPQDSDELDGLEESRPADPEDVGLDRLLSREDMLLDIGLDQLAPPARREPSLADTSMTGDGARDLDEDDRHGHYDDPDDDDDDDDMDLLDDDDTDDVSFPDDPRFIDSGYGGECLRETEDIDFQFVYALHSFVATVEGQANASKGETMVLLDDSNSYWWLVRVVKDSSIGYLPAEHIETPTERLARLNKHRNIDLSATMLSDNAERSKNPLKKAMRRRNAKTVVFSEPTYYEASDYDYSTDDEEQDQDGLEDGGEAEPNEMQHDQPDDQDEITAVEPLRPNASAAKSATDTSVSVVNAPDANESRVRSSTDDNAASKSEAEDRIADAIVKPRHVFGGKTDSFLGDDTMETRKITLTPNLLRDDSSSAAARPSEPRDAQVRPKASLEILERSGASDKSKEDKKKREKKPGMLSGLFRRKDKKPKATEDDGDDVVSNEKQSVESSRGSPVQESSEDLSRPEPQKGASAASAPTKDVPNKLQKKSRSDAPSSRDGPVRSAASSREPSPRRMQGPNRLASSTLAGASSVRSSEDNGARQGGRARSDSAQRRSPEPAYRQPSQPQPQEQMRQVPREAVREAGNVQVSQSNASSGPVEPKPDTIRMVDRRMEVEDLDPIAHEAAQLVAPAKAPRPADFGGVDALDVRSTPPPTRPAPMAAAAAERLSESPVEVERPSGIAVDSRLPSSTDWSRSKVEEVSDSASTTTATTPPAAASSSSLALTEGGSGSSGEAVGPAKTSPAHTVVVNTTTTTTTTTDDELERTQTPSPSTTNTSATTATTTTASNGTASTPTWSDASLRTYLDQHDHDVRDLLIVVHDRSGVVPAGPDHPVVGGLFKEENARLAEMTSRLDSLLGDWLASKAKVTVS